MPKVHRAAARRRLSLQHANLRAAMPKLDVVHEPADQEYPAAMVREELLGGDGRGNLHRIETGARVAHDNEHAPFLVAGHGKLHCLARVVGASIAHGSGTPGADLREDGGGRADPSRVILSVCLHILLSRPSAS